MSATVNVGCVHGRFQPFHLGHLEYVLRGYELSNLLYIGLANSDPSHIDEDRAAPHRHRDDANPFVYFERMEMVFGSLAEAGIDHRKVRIVPFPINKPELLRFYVPIEAVQLITIYDDWGEKKLWWLENLGYSLQILWRREKKFITGTEIRQLLKDNQPISSLVPGFVDKYIQERGYTGPHG